MSPGDHECERRVGNLAAFEIASPDVAFDVIHADQRNPAREGERLGEGDAGQQRPDEAGTVRDRDRLDVIEADLSLAERLLHHRRQVEEVLPGSDLGHHPSELRVLGDLGRDDVREDAPAVLDDGGRGLVAGCLDPQDEHAVRLIPASHSRAPRRASEASNGGRAMPRSVTMAVM